jgi:hypothetical protein
MSDSTFQQGLKRCHEPASTEEIPLIVSLTTLPSRIDLLRPTLYSLLEQTQPPDSIFLCLPDYSVREKVGYQCPRWLLDFDRRLELVFCGRDDGPGTKLLGAVGRISTPACLVIVDDDLKYREQFLSLLYREQTTNRHSSFTYYTYPCGPFVVGQGADGFSFYTPNLKGIEEFASRVLVHRHLRLVDDLWISAFLQRQGVEVRSIAHLIPGGGRIYEFTHKVNQLQDLEDDFARQVTMLAGARFLLESGLMGPSARAISLFKKALRPLRDGLLKKRKR